MVIINHMRTFILSSANAICSELAARCKAVRLQRNLTQQQLASMVQVSLSSMRRFEAQGQGSLEMFVKIAQALQVVAQLEPLLLAQDVSIAELEKQAQPLRKRARA